MKLKMVTAAVLSIAMLASISGCGQQKQDASKTEDGKTLISVGAWPKEDSNKEQYDHYMDIKSRFEAANSDISIQPDSWTFSVDSFMAKAASGSLPVLYEGYFTECNRIVSAGYCADLTDAVKKYGYDKQIKDSLKSLVMKDGKYYAIPKTSYTMGLYINKKMFKNAGLVNEDGSVKIPQTYDELAQFAAQIREKTGQAGIIVNTANGTGGWNFLNIAWSYGTEFMKQDENGAWKATFDSPECVAALQFIKDLKWKYNAIPESSTITGTEQQKYFASDQAAMFIGTPPQDELVKQYNMNTDDICIASLPAGPAGRFAQVGGTLSFIKAGATDDQIDACFRLIDFANWGYGIDEEAKTTMEGDYKVRAEKGLPIGFYQYSPWSDSTERSEYEHMLIDKYANISPENVKEFNNPPADLQLKPEEPVCCQELYTTLDACIQEVIVNENADCAQLIKEAAENFQSDFLDNAQ